MKTTARPAQRDDHDGAAEFAGDGAIGDTWALAAFAENERPFVEAALPARPRSRSVGSTLARRIHGLIQAHRSRSGDRSPIAAFREN
jgi:hypothetical protein